MGIAIANLVQRTLFGLFLTSKGNSEFSGYLKFSTQKIHCKSQGKLAIFRVVFRFSGYFNLWRISPKITLKDSLGVQKNPFSDDPPPLSLVRPLRWS